MKKEDKKNKPKKEEEEEEEEEEEVEEEVEEEEQDIVGEDFSKDPRAFSYLQDAGRIADEVLKFTIEQCKPSANIYNICQQSDALIKDKLSKIYTKKNSLKELRSQPQFPSTKFVEITPPRRRKRRPASI